MSTYWTRIEGREVAGLGLENVYEIVSGPAKFEFYNEGIAFRHPCVFECSGMRGGSLNLRIHCLKFTGTHGNDNVLLGGQILEGLSAGSNAISFKYFLAAYSVKTRRGRLEILQAESTLDCPKCNKKGTFECRPRREYAGMDQSFQVYYFFHECTACGHRREYGQRDDRETHDDGATQTCNHCGQNCAKMTFGQSAGADILS